MAFENVTAKTKLKDWWKPVQDEILKRVEKEDGKGLSTNDYTDAEKKKLAGVDDGANNYVLPAATAAALGGVKVGDGLSVTADGKLSANAVKYLSVSPDDDSLKDKDFADGIYRGNYTEAIYRRSYYLISVSYDVVMPTVVQVEKFQFLIDNTGTKMRHGTVTGGQINYTDWASLTAENNAGAHNAVYRGKFLGNSVTSEQYAMISAGTFDDLYIGDYWTIGGVNYRIAAFDYYYNTGDIVCTTHHVTLVPDVPLDYISMNSTATTTGAYAGSFMYTTGLNSAKNIVASAFGSEHILSHRTLLQNATSGTYVTGVSWYQSSVDLMTEQNVYGCKIFGDPMRSGNLTVHTLDTSQFPLFSFRHDLIANGQWYWLRDFAYSGQFALVFSAGNADCRAASTVAGVRPAFSIIG